MSSDFLAKKPQKQLTDIDSAASMELQPPNDGHWQSQASATHSTLQKDWLFRSGALTASLRQQGQLNLTVVREYPHQLSPSEAWMLKSAAQTSIWTREIIMSINGINSVFARSFTPLIASHGVWRGMRGLHTRPLADMLYHDPEITRSPFFISRLSQQQPLYLSVQQFLGKQCPDAHHLLARCSVFWRSGQPLVVAECFLPDFWQLAQPQDEHGK